MITIFNITSVFLYDFMVKLVYMVQNENDRSSYNKTLSVPTEVQKQQQQRFPSFPMEPALAHILRLFPTSFPPMNTYRHWKLSQGPIVTLHRLYFDCGTYFDLIFTPFMS